MVFVNRLAYDLKVPLTDRSLAVTGEPQRGDIVTFVSPKDGVRLIKRLVALPGDVVALQDKVLVINGQRADYADVLTLDEPIGNGLQVQALRATEALAGNARAVQMFPALGSAANFGPLTVPAGHYFMMGDSRDNSVDSRFYGPVPRHLLIGRAGRILVSADTLGNWMPRLERTWSVLR